MLDEAGLKETKIVISNDVDEYLIETFKKQGGVADIWGIGTKLVTCYGQPALGGVYKMVEFEKDPKIKISEDMEKTNIPSEKVVIRLFKKGIANTKAPNEKTEDRMIYDVILHEDELNVSNYKQNITIFEKIDLSGIENPYMGYKAEKSGKLGKLGILEKKGANSPDSYDYFEVKLNSVMENGKLKQKQKCTLDEARNTMKKDISRLGENYWKLHDAEEYQIFITKQLVKMREELQHKYKKT